MEYFSLKRFGNQFPVAVRQSNVGLLLPEYRPQVVSLSAEMRHQALPNQGMNLNSTMLCGLFRAGNIHTGGHQIGKMSVFTNECIVQVLANTFRPVDEDRKSTRLNSSH